MSKQEDKAKNVWICTFCGTPYDTEQEATKCWESHNELTIEYIWGGIGSKTDMPIECIIKKHERGMITEIGTYELKEVKQVKMRERQIEKRD